MHSTLVPSDTHITRSSGGSLQEFGPCAARACNFAGVGRNLNFFMGSSLYLNDGNHLKIKKSFTNNIKSEHNSEVYTAEAPSRSLLIEHDDLGMSNLG